MRTLRVATANLLHGVSLVDGSTDGTRLADAIAVLEADVVGLQEVDRAQPRSGEVDQTAVIAEAMDAAWWRFVPTIRGTPNPQRRWDAADEDDGALVSGPTYGISLVSRLPVRSWHVRRFSAAPVGAPLLVPGHKRLVHMPDEPRVALAAVIEGPSGPFTVVNAHLSFVPGWNMAQLRRLVRWAATWPGPRLLLGDLNVPGRVPARVSGWTQLARTPTYPSYRPRVQFDHVLGSALDGIRAQSATARALPVSDHCALTVDLVIPSQRSLAEQHARH